ncbi:MAG: hypothetical protein V4493_01170 [Pseudomonadota bacterium]
MNTVAPKVIAVADTEQKCFIAAELLNKESSEIKTKEYKEAGAEFVCMKMIYPV